MLELTAENYYSPEANEEYMSASFVKAMRKCEAAAMAELRGEWERPESTALLQGQFVDECLTGDYGAWVMKHPEVSRRDGNLKAEFMKCQEMVTRARKDRVFMDTMEGEHQVIRTGILMLIRKKKMKTVIMKVNAHSALRMMRLCF